MDAKWSSGWTQIDFYGGKVGKTPNSEVSLLK